MAHLDASEFFDSTPPRTRARNRNKSGKSNNLFKSSSDFADGLVEFKPRQSNAGIRAGMFGGDVNSPRSSLRKKRSEIRSQLRDAKVFDAGGVEDDGLFSEKNIIIGSSTRNASNVLMLGSSHPLRCLSASCLSESDFADPANKSKATTQKPLAKSGKKRIKPKFPKISASDKNRQRYMQRLRQVVAMGNNKQCQVDADRKAVDAKSQRYELRRNEVLWLELQAWYNNCTIIEQDQILYDARQLLVSEVLDFVSDFQFDPHHVSILEKLEEKIDIALQDMPEVACEDCEKFAVVSPLRFDASCTGQLSAGDVCHVNTETAGSYESLRSVRRFGDNPGTNDTRHSEPGKAEDDFENNVTEHRILPDYEYMVTLNCAIGKVGAILKLLCIIENLYPSSSSLAKEYPFCNSSEYRMKVESLCSWFNIASDLSERFASIKRLLFFNHRLNNNQIPSIRTPEGGAPNLEQENTFSFVTESEFQESIHLHTNRILKQKSVKTILQSFINKHFTALYRAKLNLLANSHYTDPLQAENNETDSCPVDNHTAHFTLGSEDAEELSPLKEPHKYLRSFSTMARQHQTNELCRLFGKIMQVLPQSNFQICQDACMEKIFDEAAPISPSDKDTAIFGLPSIQPLYVLIPSVLFAIMRHCMHSRLEQAIPFFHNKGSSISLLTAKQLVMESREMLECALLSRDIVYFFIIDGGHSDPKSEFMGSVKCYDSDLRSMINTYLDFVNTWLVRMLSDLPHAPREFQDILEREWEFAVNISPSVGFDSMVASSCRFIQISKDIVNSTHEFLVSAISALIDSQNQDLDIQSISDDDTTITFARQNSDVPTENSLNITENSFRPGQAKSRAGILWYLRQRSESPHLSQQNSVSSSSSFTPVGSPTELDRQTSTSSTSSSGSLTWFQYKSISRQQEYQRRYLFELCRAVKDLFGEARERAARVLSFGKFLRKSLEPAIGFDFLDPEDSKGDSLEDSCPNCQLLLSLSRNGFVQVDVSGSDVVSKRAFQSDLVDLNQYWIFVPSPVPVLEWSYNASDDEESAEPDPSMIWKRLKNALFNHLHISDQKQSENSEEESADRQYVLFVKKPKGKGNNADSSTGHRRRSDIDFSQKMKKTTGRPRKKKKSLKSKSESNLHNRQMTANDSDIVAEPCGHIYAWDGPLVKVFSGYYDPQEKEDHIQFFRIICKSFELNHDVTAVLGSAGSVGVARKALLFIFPPSVRLVVGQMPILQDFKRAFDLLRLEVIKLCSALMKSIKCVMECLEVQSDKILRQRATRAGSSDVDSWRQIESEVNEVMQSCFNFGFDVIRDTTKLMSGDFRMQIGEMHKDFAKQWMEYVVKHRQKGKGTRPRWASQGLTFIVSIDSAFLLTLTETDFQSLKQQIDEFIRFLIGETPSSQKSEDVFPLANKPNILSTLQEPANEPQVLRSLSNSSTSHVHHSTGLLQEELTKSLSFEDNENEEEDNEPAPIERIRFAIAELEQAIDDKRFSAKNIGRVTNTTKPSPIVNLGVRTVNFQWQRGTKIGEGAFGRVYTCVNVDTGKILAMKEVKFQPNDHKKIRTALDEFTNFEGIKHENLVRYYGIELHREEMYIFMEYCDGGTLGDVCKINLPEPMIRRYTSQILAAVHTLHINGIVHRDIKGSNIFLMSSGTVKLGDFGSALKLNDKFKTTPGEMVSYIGTTLAYTAPEVINSSKKVGYGRASDIWSLGCVVIEMATGSKPWHDLEHFQVMFKVGSGSAPPLPKLLSEEGKHFVQLCINPNPGSRWSAEQLLDHPFVKVTNIDK